MRKSVLFIVICSISLLTRAQSWSANGTSLYYSGGSVGIGTSAPNTLLELKNPVAAGLGPILRLTGGGSANAQTAIDLATYDPGGNAPGGRIIATDDGNYSCFLNFQTKVAGSISNALQTRMTITDNGNVGIGITNTDNYMLAVNGPAIFTKAVVQVQPWSDYVFKKEYPLLPLDSVAGYIRTHSHLPGIPSADSVEKSGLDLGGNQAALLKKIEELTLYAIEQQRQIKRQQEQIEVLVSENKKINDLQVQIDKLTASMKSLSGKTP